MLICSSCGGSAALIYPLSSSLHPSFCLHDTFSSLIFNLMKHVVTPLPQYSHSIIYPSYGDIIQDYDVLRRIVCWAFTCSPLGSHSSQSDFLFLTNSLQFSFPLLFPPTFFSSIRNKSCFNQFFPINHSHCAKLRMVCFSNLYTSISFCFPLTNVFSVLFQHSLLSSSRSVCHFSLLRGCYMYKFPLELSCDG